MVTENHSPLCRPHDPGGKARLIGQKRPLKPKDAPASARPSPSRIRAKVLFHTTFSASAPTMIEEVRFATDSALEEEGFEPSVSPNGVAYLRIEPQRRSRRPGRAPVCSPRSITATPLTITISMPLGYWCGSS
jgi:hypothetical protein